MLLSIIILNYKKPQLTIKCLNSIFKYYKKKFDEGLYELIIADNYSKDDSVLKIKKEIKDKKYKNVKILENSENFGFGKGINESVKIAKGEFVLLLNNDTVVEDLGIDRMLSFMIDHREVSILGGKLSNIDGSNQVSVGKFYNITNVLMLLLGMQRAGITDRNPKQIKEVDWVKGGLMMIRKSAFLEIGGFDENIFMYTDDMEFCFRAKKMGFRTFFYPDVYVLHHDQGSSDREFAVVNIYKGILYFYKKHKSPLEYFFIKGVLYIKAIAAIIIGSLTGNKYLTTTFKKAIQF